MDTFSNPKEPLSDPQSDDRIEKNRIIIGNLNINSISSKFDELITIIPGNIDILVLTETKSDASFPTA